MDEKKKEKIVKFFRQMLQVYDFELIIDINKDLENVFRLNDIQNGNLNGIEQEEFYILSDIIERLDTYHQDIVYTPLENKQSNNEKIAKDDWNLVAKRYLENETVVRVLNEIDTKKYVDLISKKEKFHIQDIIKILNEDEQFCKNVCQKYIDTMSKEMLLEIDNKILHIFIEDEYINLKEEGKINNQNYKEYLEEKDIEYKDYGTNSEERTDYPIYAKKVAEAIQNGEADKGILICRSGFGMTVAANKFKGIRAAAIYNEESAKFAKADDDINVITLGADYLTENEAICIIRNWLASEFKGGKYEERLKMVEEIERNNMK